MIIHYRFDMFAMHCKEMNVHTSLLRYCKVHIGEMTKFCGAQRIIHCLSYNNPLAQEIASEMPISVLFVT